MLAQVTLKIILIIAAIALSVIIPFIACNDTQKVGGSTQVQITSRVSDITNCKTAANDRHGMNCESPYEGLAYIYHGDGRLILRHINAGFNCCGQPLTAVINASDTLIDIQENESDLQACHCLCLYDLEYEISYLSGDSVRVKFNGLYLNSDEEGLSTVIDLTEPSSGSFCVERGHYPWTIIYHPPDDPE